MPSVPKTLTEILHKHEQTMDALMDLDGDNPLALSALDFITDLIDYIEEAGCAE